MTAELNSFADLLTDQTNVYQSLKKLIQSLMDSARAKDGPRVASVTQELVELEERATRLDRGMIELIAVTAPKHGVEPKDFKLSMLAGGADQIARIDALRLLVSETARLSAQATGVLSANIEVIDQTIKVLESIDARGVGYGSDRTHGAAARPSKMIDRSA